MLNHAKYIINESKNKQETNVCINNNFIRLDSAETMCDSKYTNCLTKKYFTIWKDTIKVRNEKIKLLEDKLDKNIRLDKLIKNIKKQKKCEHTNHSAVEKLEGPKQLGSTHNYKNRFIAQKNIINLQKAKLDEQNKIIEELRLGIIREDILKSLENTKINIREIFSNCSEKVKCKVPILLIEENKKFTVNIQKAPKIIQQMEDRALQRERNRQIILEKKRLIEETRQKMLEEAIEKKRIIEDEERQRNLDIIKERRKHELELEKLRQIQKQKYLKNLNKAINFYNKLLIKKYFKKLFNNVITSRHNDLIAKNHYKTIILKRSIFYLYNIVEETYKEKFNIADTHFACTILKKTMKTWHNFHIENVRNMQVAEDIYDFHLTSNTFIHWHRYVCSQIVLQHKHVRIADKHYIRKILLQYYYQWRSLPAVIQLEKAKELKKQKWREKVWEVLPDYRPEDV